MGSGRDRSIGRLANTRALRAFSLVELLIVIVLMGIAAAVLIPRLEPGLQSQLVAAAEVVSGDLGYARNLAVVNNSSYQISFEPSGNRYTLQHVGDNTLLDTLPESPFQEQGAQADQHVTDFGDMPHLGPTVKLFSVRKLSDPPESVLDIEFTPLGATKRAEVTRIWLSCGTSQHRLFVSVSVDPTTGLATIGAVKATTPPASESQQDAEESNDPTSTP